MPILQRSGFAAAATVSSCSSSQASLPAEKYGSSGIPLRSRTSASVPSATSRSSTSCERLSCQVTTGVSGSPLSASQASTDSPWWSSPQATTSPSAADQQLRHRLDDGGHDRLGILLHPAGLGVRERLLPACLGEGPELGVEEDRLDGRGALVDAEQEAHRATCSAVRRHQGLSAPGAAAPVGGPRARQARRRAPPMSSHDALGDPQRSGQAGRAYRGHVDQRRACFGGARSRS